MRCRKKIYGEFISFYDVIHSERNNNQDDIEGMAKSHITWVGLLIRFLVALVLVLSTYNPEGYSYVEWALLKLPEFSILKGFAGVVLIIGWTVYLRATLRSLGAFGLLLATAFFGTLIWLIVDWGIVPADSVRAVTYIILIVCSLILATGISWSHIRRRISGQVDVDEIEDKD